MREFYHDLLTTSIYILLFDYLDNCRIFYTVRLLICYAICVMHLSEKCQMVLY